VSVDFDELDGATRYARAGALGQTWRWGHARGWRHSLERLRRLIETASSQVPRR